MAHVGIPTKTQELETLQVALRSRGIVFFPVTPGRRGDPDLVVVAACPVAVWLRRSELARPLTADQNRQIDAAASQGWDTVIAFGSREALRELRRRGLEGSPHAAA